MKIKIIVALILVIFPITLVRTNFAQTSNPTDKSSTVFSLSLIGGKDELGKGNYQNAVTYFSRHIESYPNDDEGYAQRARAYFLLKNFDLAIADAEKALSIESKNIDALNIHGLVKVERKDFDSALADFTSAINIKPDFIKPYMNRAKILIDKKEFDKAVFDYTKVIGLNSQDGYPYYLRGSVYLYSIKNYDLAIKDYTEAIKLNPNSNSSYFSRGQAFSKKSSYNEAIADYTKAIEIDPADAFSFYFRGNAYAALNKTAQATADYKKAVEFDPKYEPFVLALANITKKDADQTAPPRDAELRKKFINLTTEFNALRKIYDEKSNAYSPISDKEYARYMRNIDPAYKKTAEDKSIRISYCKALLELDPAITNLQKIAVALKEMNKNGEAAKAASTQELAAMSEALKKWDFQELHRPFSIAVGDCRANPTDKEVTLDDIVKMANRENQQTLAKLMIKLGNFSGYLTAVKNLAAINLQTAAPSEICGAALQLTKESDVIEPDLKEFVKLYQYDTPPDFDDPDHPARHVTFDDPAITVRAEKTLSLYNKLFLPNKESIKNVIGKYGCK